MITAVEAAAMLGVGPRLGDAIDPQSYLGRIIAEIEIAIKGVARHERETAVHVRVNEADEKQLQKIYEDAGFDISLSEERELTMSNDDRSWVEFIITW
jgi:hypothetical protein